MTISPIIVSSHTIPGSFEGWESLCDRVMGGMSEGTMHTHTDGSAVFEGVVRFDFGGGFASLRKDIPGALDISKCSLAAVSVKGPPKTYKLRLRCDSNYDGISFEHEFIPRVESFTDIEMPLEQFYPVFRGKRLSDSYQLDPHRICSVGLMIAARQGGPFSLHVHTVGFR